MPERNIYGTFFDLTNETIIAVRHRWPNACRIQTEQYAPSSCRWIPIRRSIALTTTLKRTSGPRWRVKRYHTDAKRNHGMARVAPRHQGHDCKRSPRPGIRFAESHAVIFRPCGSLPNSLTTQTRPRPPLSLRTS